MKVMKMNVRARRGGAGAMFRNRKGVEEGRESLMIKREGQEGGGEHNGALAAYLLTFFIYLPSAQLSSTIYWQRSTKNSPETCT